MSTELWNAVDAYVSGSLAANDAALEHALAASRAARLPDIHVAPNQGKFLQVLARSVGARRILEVGTLGGYSTIWLARALPDEGRIVTLELDPRHADVARSNFARAGLDRRIELRLGPALESLAALAAERVAPFDFVFLDADKPNNPRYFERALELTRSGGLIVVDNVIREGKVIDAASADANVRGVRELFELLAAEPRVIATAIQTVGTKGHDGFAFAYVR
ncbi:MAG: O-methyltransferase [Planctomycetes bacterium]|nr:O-methyltransferase [Planctomycetota bacterium]